MKQSGSSSQSGSLPTSGGNRPGPFALTPPIPAIAPSVPPIGMRLVRLGIDVSIEAADFSLTFPDDPATPWVAAWYRRSALLGEPGVVLIGGKTAIDDAGPSAFTRLKDAEQDDLIEVSGSNSASYRYRLESVDPEATSPDFTSLLKLQDAERIALVAWDGTFPSVVSGRTVVMALGFRER